MIKRATAEEFDAALHSALTSVASSPEGARVLHWLIYDTEVGRLEEPSFSPDLATCSMLEGRRAVARAVVNELRKIDDRFNTGLSNAVRDARLVPVALTKEK